ncbi:hypothetical protein LLG96_02595 [bacterium]|nr:hypothetical protein [bacterium]
MSKHVSRRGFFSGSSALAAAAAVALGGKSGAASAAPKGCMCGVKPFMEQYYDGMMEIIRGQRDTQTGVIARAMEKAYELSKKGGTLYANVVYGHFGGNYASKDRPGQPWVLPSYTTLSKEMVDAMKPGDFLITNIVDEGRKTARERGVFMVGVTNNYFKFSRTKPEGLVPGRMAMTVEEMSDIVIDSFVPWNNGLVSAPQIPQFKLCPSTGTVEAAVYWACSASLANLVGSKGKGSASEPAEKYLDLVLERFVCVGADRPKIDRVASTMADYVLEKHARLFVYGEPFSIDGDRSGNMFVSDACGAASGTMIAQAYNEAEVRENDIVLVCSVRSNQPQELDVARAARKKGAYTIAICPYTTDGDASGDRLYKEVDVAFNTFCGESEGVIAAEGFPKKVCPVSGLTGNLLHWMLTAQWTWHMALRGEMPYYWQGFHENGGREYDNAVRPYFMKRGY